MKLPTTRAQTPYPEMKDSGVEWLGYVPAHWDIRRVKYLLNECDTRSTDGNEELLRVSQYTGVTLRSPTGDADDPDTRAASLVGYKSVEPNDLIVNIMLAWNGSMGVSQFRGITSPAYCVYRFKRKSHPWYYHHLFRSPIYKTRIRSVSTGIVESRLRLYTDDLYRLEALVPPLPEQAAIVRFLDHADRRIRRYIRSKQKLISLLEEQRKAATQEVIQSRSVTSNKIEVVADLVERPVHRVAADTYTPIGLYNRGRGIFKKEPRNGGELGDSDFFWIEKGDLVLSGQFAWEGAIALAGETESGCVASHRYPILQGRQNVLDSGFLLAFFQTDWGQLLLDHHSRGAAGRNRPLNAKTLLKEKIPLPPLRHQVEIVEMLQREKLVRQQAEDSKRLLNEYRARLISDVVSGKLDVREAADELPENDVPGGRRRIG